jgi:hypothetical protein
MTRNHRMTSMSPTLDPALRRNRHERPWFKGTLNQCLSHVCTEYLTEAEKTSLRELIAIRFMNINVNDTMHADEHDQVGNVNVNNYITKQEFKVNKKRPSFFVNELYESRILSI